MTSTVHLITRPYAGASDLPAMQALLRTGPGPHDPYPTPADLPEMLDASVSHTPRHTLVWEDVGGALVGFAIVSQYHNLHFCFRPDVLTAEREEEMIDWAMRQLRQMDGDAEASVALDTFARDDDTGKAALLRRHGFVPGDDLTLYMARALHDPLPLPQLPPAFVLRPLGSKAEVPAYVAAHRAAYGTQKMTEELRLSIMRQPHYRPDIDLVAIAPDGTLAAFCVCSVNDEENTRSGQLAGEIAIVGTHPAFQGQGLGRAMVLAGLRALKDQGMETAFLTVAGDNARAISVYEAAGFRTDWQMRWYTKTGNKHL